MLHVCPECGTRYETAGVCTVEGTTLEPASDPLLGETIGRWRITRLLGSGGMGRVYRAVQPEIGSRVAVKVLSNELVHNQEAVDRFFAEARAVNLIRHEQIVDVLDLARLPDGRPYIVMEYLDGEPLSSVIAKRGALPLGTLVELALQILDALAATHNKGIIHRDLKPDNIFISPGGHPKVLDFGIAKLEAKQPGVEGTRMGAIMGTPHYLSPEQAHGRAVDARSDLYSMGVVLYEASTGKKPFDADSMFELLRQHVEAPPPPPRSLRPDMPPAYEQVILKALAKEPAQRFARADEMTAALVAASAALPPDAWQTLRVTTETPAARPPSSLSRARSTARPPSRRRGWAVAFAAFFGVAALAVAAVAVLMNAAPKPIVETRPPDAAPVAIETPTPNPTPNPNPNPTPNPTPNPNPNPPPRPNPPPNPHPVRVTGMHSNQGWIITLSVVPRPTEIFVKLPHDADFRSLGKNEQAFDADNNPLPNTFFPLDDDKAAGPLDIAVKYTDATGATHGPVTVTFDPRAQRLAESRRILDMVHWISFRWYDKRMLVYFTGLRMHEPVLKHVRYGIDGPPSTDVVWGKDWFEVPKGSKAMTVELEFIDGGRSEKRFDVPEPPANPDEDRYYQ